MVCSLRIIKKLDIDIRAVMIYNDNMDKVEKIVRKFNKSDAGQSYEDCEKILLSLGYSLRNTKGSHRVFKKGDNYIVIAKHKPVSKGAVKDVLDAWENYHEK